MAMYHLIYISIGSARLQCELIYSMISFHRMAGQWSKQNIRIIVYTDLEFSLPDILNDINVIFRVVGMEFIEHCRRRANGNVFIMKPLLLERLFKEFDTKAILVDTDTYFIQDIRQIFERIDTGRFVLHLKEQNVSCRDSLSAFLRTRQFRNMRDLDLLSINDETYMWNSGVVGMTSSDSYLLREICFLIEQLSRDENYPGVEWHTVEQLSFSYYFAKQGEIWAAERSVTHYWFFKQYRYFLGFHFNYFHGNDEVEFLDILAQNGLDRLNIATDLTEQDLTYSMVLLMKKYLEIPEVLLQYIPADTFVGNMMRIEFGTR